ncbi:minor capsid protein [Cohnella suwonensis]|uniref:Minor capsid protein n=1 Tax=Cohnella suwonensis TaxID=696072 RepID=A0ABW0LV42_9BACL
MTTRSNSYWERRSRSRMAEYHREADSTMAVISSAYDKARRDIDVEIEKIFRTYGTNGKMDPAKAKKVLNGYIPNPLFKLGQYFYPMIRNPRVKQWLLNKLNAPAYRARITRLEALKEQIYLQSKLIADVEIVTSTLGYVRTIKEAYYRTAFDLQRGTGYAYEFAAMPVSTVETILKRPWSSEQFSARVWRNTDVLSGQLTEVITAGFLAGTSLDKMRRDIQERMQVGKHAANRLLRTETTYMANASEMEAYAEADVDEYRFVATLDLRTSQQCRQHDNKVYLVKEAMPGSNMPPLHVYCRSTTIAVIDVEKDEELERRARDPKTGETMTVPASTSYEEWRAGLGQQHGEERISTFEKQIQNGAADRKQYEQYRIVLRGTAPKSFAAFRELKYTGSEEWERLKADYRKLNAYDKVAANEPKITTDLKEISTNTGTDLVGLEYRLKTRSSYLRKVNSDSQNSLDAKVISDTIAGTNDIIRYTFQAADDKLTAAFFDVTQAMEEKGYVRHKLKNTWNDKRNPYKGINGIFVSPSGQRFEVQFHTPESFELKNGPLHKLYEEYRLDATSSERRAELTLEMFTMSARLARPKDIDTIK